MPMKMKRKRTVRLIPIEKAIYLTGLACLVAIVVIEIFVGTKVSNLKMNIE